MGNVQLLIDTIAPTISTVGWKNGASLANSSTLVLKCKDDIDDIDSFRAELDGKWLLFAASKDNFIYHFDEHCSKGAHSLNVTVTDFAGNTTKQIFTFIK